MTDSSRRWLASGSWTAAPTSQIVFIDGSVPQAQQLARDVGPDVVAVVLNADQDGVRQIAEWLTTHHVQDTAAIDVVAPGAACADRQCAATRRRNPDLWLRCRTGRCRRCVPATAITGDRRGEHRRL